MVTHPQHHEGLPRSVPPTVADGATQPIAQCWGQNPTMQGQQQLVAEGGISGHLQHHLLRDLDDWFQGWDGLKLKVSLHVIDLAL